MPAVGDGAFRAVGAFACLRALRPCAAASAMLCVLFLGQDSTVVSAQELNAYRPAQGERGNAVRIIVAPTLVVEPSKRTRLPIHIDSAGNLPSKSFVRLRGLPAAASLSEGYAIAAGVWAVPLSALPVLEINVPVGVTGRSELTISLVSLDGPPLAEAQVLLSIAAAAPQSEMLTATPDPRQIAAPAPPTRPNTLAIPVLAPEERARAEKLITRGEQDLNAGNIALARSFFLRAAEAGLAQGALLLATTYDARELARIHALGVLPDLAAARKWYERARELGSPEASERLGHLGRE
jgi:hypothetical protein